MTNTINSTKQNVVVNTNFAGNFKPTFSNVDLWNIHKMVKGRVYRKHF